MMILEGISASHQPNRYLNHSYERTEDDIRDEEYSACNVVLISGETNICIHAFNFGIANVSPIDVTEKVQDS